MSVAILYNPKSPRGASIAKHWFDKREWNISENSLVQIPEEHVRAHLMETYGFLEEVQPSRLDDYKARMVTRDYKCAECDLQFDKKSELTEHMRTHGFQADNETIADIPVLKASKQLAPGSTLIKPVLTQEGIESQEGIAVSGHKDADGVEWVGEGLEQDTGSSMEITKPGDPGQF